MVTEQIGGCLGTKAGRGERKVLRGHEDTVEGHGCLHLLVEMVSHIKPY